MNEGFMPTMLQIPTMRSHMTRSPASPTHHRTFSCFYLHSRGQPCWLWSHGRFHPAGGAAGWKVTTAFLCREKPDRNWWPQTSGTNPHPPTNRKPLQVNECGSDSIQENLGNLPVENSSYPLFTALQDNPVLSEPSPDGSTCGFCGTSPGHITLVYSRTPKGSDRNPVISTVW